MQHPADGPRPASRWSRTLRGFGSAAEAALQRTPLEVALGVAAWIGYAVAVEQESLETWAGMLFAVLIALPLVYAASALFATGSVSANVRWALSAAAVVAGALYGFLVFDTERAAEGWRAAALVGASIMALLAAPLVMAEAHRRRDWAFLFGARLAVRMAIVAAYALALFAGLAAAIGAIDGLFELDLDGKAYGHLAGVVFVLIPPWAVAAGLQELVAPAAPVGPIPRRLLRWAGLYLLIPLVLVYLAIVYAYLARVLATGEVPKNLVSPVVLGAGGLVLLATVVLEPLHGDPGSRGLSRLVRVLPPLLLPLFVFAAWAVQVRVEQYGWTEFRYLRIAAILGLGAFAVAATVALVRRRLPPLPWVPAVGAVILLLAAVGPWSAPAVSLRSQSARLAALLRETGVAGAAEAPVGVESDAYRRIVEVAHYVRTHFGWEELAEVAPRVGPEPEPDVYPDVARLLGIEERIAAGDTVPRTIAADLPAGAGIQGVRAGTLYPFDIARASRMHGPGDAGRTGVSISIDSAASRVRVRTPVGDTLSADLGPLTRAVVVRAGRDAGTPIFEITDREPTPVRVRSVHAELQGDEAAIPLRDAAGAVRGQLLLRSLAVRVTPIPGAAPRVTLERAGGFVLLSGGG